MSKQRASRETGMGAAAGIRGMPFICNCFFVLFSLLVSGSFCLPLILLILMCALSGGTRETEDISRAIADGASGAGKFTVCIRVVLHMYHKITNELCFMCRYEHLWTILRFWNLIDWRQVNMCDTLEQ